MKRLLVSCLSFMVPIMVFVVLVGSLPMVSEAEAKKKATPPKKGGGDGAPDVLMCYYLAVGPITPKPRPPDVIAIVDGDVHAAVAECLARGGHPHGLN